MSQFLEIVTFWYKLHYQQHVSHHLSNEQKQDILKRISDLTLKEPIWLDKKTDYGNKFPEIKPYVNVPLTGLYLIGIMKGIIEELKEIPQNIS